MKKTKKSLILMFALLAIILVLAGCSSKDDKSVRIGYQKGVSINILKERGTLEAKLEDIGYKVQWTEFAGGPALLEALNVGSIDFGHTGEAPPIFAQAAKAPLVYLAHTEINEKAEAILVHEDSAIHTAQDLVGKKVALNKGSNVHYLLVEYLAANGLNYADVDVQFLPPADARAAFDSKNVDAWVIWDPFYSSAVVGSNAKVLADGTGLVNNFEFYLGSKSFATDHNEAVQVILEAIRESDEWARANQADVVKMLAPILGIEEAAIERTLAIRAWGVIPVDESTVAGQQAIADAFYELKLIPEKLDVREAFLD